MTAGAVCAATLLEDVFDGRQSGSPFHPAMVACALALLLFPTAAAPSVHDTTSIWIAAAYALAGMALIAAGCIRWQVPLAMMASATLCYLPWSIAGNSLHGGVSLFALLPSLMLTVFFIATNPPSGCMLPRARWLFGLASGALAMLAIGVSHGDAQALLGVAGSVLLMNAAAPWLDRVPSDRISDRSSIALQRKDAADQ